MAGIFNGPSRGGTRGGRDQFSWDNVKSDKEREYYLGHSVKALTGRWQKGKDVYWYTRDVDEEGGEAAASAELAMVKQREQDLMMEALGVKPKVPKQLKPTQLDKADMQKLLEGAGDQEEAPGAAGAAAAAAAAEADRVKGLGYGASMTTGAIQAGTDREMLAGVGGAPSGPAAGVQQQQQQAAAAGGQHAQRGGAGGAVRGPALTAEQIAELKRLRKRQEKKEAKRAKKEAKKAKKERKKSKKDRKEKKRRASSSSGSSGSEGGSSGGEEATAPRGRQLPAERGREERREERRAPSQREGQQQHRQGRSRSRSPARHERRPSSCSRELRQGRDRSRSRSRSPARKRHDRR